MTQEVQNQIIGQFWGIVPTIIIIIVVAALLGIGFKIIEKKMINTVKKKKQNKSDKSN